MNLCRECGITANILTCLKRYGHPPHQLAYTVSTVHKGECSVCHEVKSVTEARDFFHPETALMKEIVEYFKESHDTV